MGWYPGDNLGSMSNDAAVMRFTELHPLPFDGDFSEPAKFEEFSILLEKDVQLKSVFTQKYTPAMMSEMYRQLQELIRLKVINKCDTMPKFLSPVIMVMQKNKIRMCINYQVLNSLCRSRAYCMPDLHSHIDDLKAFKFYASCDLMKCYNQFGIKKNDRSYAAFSTPFGNFMPTRVQFGFQGAPACVQSILSESLRNFPGCEDFRLFIDNAAVGANSMEKLYVKIDAFLKFCTAFNLKLQKDKGVRALKYLGVAVCEHGKYLDPSRIQAARKPDLDYSQTRRECSRLVQACKICQKIRGLDSKVKTRFSHINKHPWEEISIDTLTFSSPDADFCRYMVVIVDSFTRYTEIFPVKDTTAETIVQCLLRIYSRYGSPTTIRCDGGPQFRSDLIKQFHSLTQVKMLQVIPYHPQANGKVEARQGQIMRHLRAMVLSDTLSVQPLACYKGAGIY